MSIGSRSSTLGVLLAVTVPAVAVAALSNVAVFEAGDPITAVAMNQNFAELRIALQELRAEHEGLVQQINGGLIRADREVAVADCLELGRELSALTGITIERPAKVTLLIASGVHRCEQLAPQLPFGLSVELRGIDQENVSVLQFADSGIVVDGPYGLRVTNVRLEGATKGSGISASRGAVVELKSVEVTNFVYGVRANSHGYIEGWGILAHENTANGFFAEKVGVMELWGCVARNNGRSGFFSTGLSRMVLGRDGDQYTQAVGNGQGGDGGFGFAATAGASIHFFDEVGAAIGSDNMEELTNVPIVDNIVQGSRIASFEVDEVSASEVANVSWFGECSAGDARACSRIANRFCQAKRFRTGASNGEEANGSMGVYCF